MYIYYCFHNDKRHQQNEILILTLYILCTYSELFFSKARLFWGHSHQGSQITPWLGRELFQGSDWKSKRSKYMFEGEHELENQPLKCYFAAQKYRFQAQDGIKRECVFKKKTQSQNCHCKTDIHVCSTNAYFIFLLKQNHCFLII